MDFAYRYGDARRLYLNPTNRCTNNCVFCVRNHVNGLGGATLSGSEEPDLPILQHAVRAFGEPEDFEEFVWCGYGEPSFRLGLMRESAAWLRSGGAKIRINTNGHACLIHGRDVLPELAAAADRISISLNAPDAGRYLQLCRPGVENPEIPARRFWEALLEFMDRARSYFEDTQASVVGYVLQPEEIDECRLLSASLGIRQFRIR